MNTAKTAVISAILLMSTVAHAEESRTFLGRGFGIFRELPKIEMRSSKVLFGDPRSAAGHVLANMTCEFYEDGTIEITKIVGHVHGAALGVPLMPPAIYTKHVEMTDEESNQISAAIADVALHDVEERPSDRASSTGWLAKIQTFHFADKEIGYFLKTVLQDHANQTVIVNQSPLTPTLVDFVSKHCSWWEY